MDKIIFLAKCCENQAVSVAAARGTLSLMERGFVRYGHAWDRPAIAAMDADECVGLLLLDHDETLKCVTVALAWCEPNRKGVLARLLIQLRDFCREKGISEVFFTCHDDNGDMAKAARALSAEPWSRTYRVAL